MPATPHPFTPLPRGSVTLLPGVLSQRAALNRRYMLSLNTENLLQNHYMEAGLWMPRDLPLEAHGGWESPTCQLRGHFLGHWLSAAAHAWANTGDAELKGKADHIVSELARCQAENGGEWAGSIPEKYLDWAARGKTRLGAALHPAQDADGAGGYGHRWRQRPGAGGAGARGALVHALDGAVQPRADGRHPGCGDRRHAGGVGQPLWPDRPARASRP